MRRSRRFRNWVLSNPSFRAHANIAYRIRFIPSSGEKEAAAGPQPRANKARAAMKRPQGGATMTRPLIKGGRPWGEGEREARTIVLLQALPTHTLSSPPPINFTPPVYFSSHPGPSNLVAIDDGWLDCFTRSASRARPVGQASALITRRPSRGASQSPRPLLGPHPHASIRGAAAVLTRSYIEP